MMLREHLKLRIFSYYIQANIKDSFHVYKRRLLQKQILDLIDSCIKDNIHVLIMGDFNTNLDVYYDKLKNYSKIRWRFYLINGLYQRNFSDL